MEIKHSSPKNGGWNTCYVNVFQSPWNVWECWKRGGYSKPTKMNLNLFRDRIIRIGSYGEPCAVPYEVWETIIKLAKGWTSYTHAWEKSYTDKRLKNICMASVDTEEEYLRAKKAGWRTFRVRSKNEALFSGEIICPASEESGRKTTCEKCRMCSGTSFGGKKDICIIIHGRKWKCQRFLEIMKRRKNKKSYKDLIPMKG